MPKFRIEPHVRLQEWVAEDLGFFREEGLDYEFDPDGFAGASTTTGSSVQPGAAAPMAPPSGASPPGGPGGGGGGGKGGGESPAPFRAPAPGPSTRRRAPATARCGARR